MKRFKKTATSVLVVFVVVLALSLVLTACDQTTTTTDVSYNITLDYDGGAISGAGSTTVSVNSGQQIDLSQYKPVKAGYIFSGWSDGKQIYKGNYTPSADVTLKAVWIKSGSNTTLNALKTLLDAMDQEGAYGFVFEGSGTDADGKLTSIALKASVSSEEKYTLGFEISDADGNRTVGIYVMDGVFYVWSPEMGGVALEDFDMDYILQVAVRTPEVLGNLLGNIDLAGFSFDTILNMLFEMFTKTTVSAEGTDTVYNVAINPAGLKSIVSLLNLINLDSLLAGAGLNIKTAGVIDWFMSILPEMTINLKFMVGMESGKLTGVQSDAVYEGEKYFEFSTVDAGFYAEDEVVPVAPEELEGYQQISLGNIDMHVDFSVENESADLGAFINAVTGTTAVPVGTLLLDSGLRYRLTLKTQLDIAQNTDTDENYIVLELDELGKDGSLKPFLSAYYKKGNVYIDVAKTVGGIYGGKGVKIGVDLKELISGVKGVVTDAIDSTFFTEGRALSGNAVLNKNGVVALSGSEGNYYVSSGALNFIQVIVGVFGVDGDKVSVTDGEDEGGKYSILNFNIDDEFLSAFLNAIGQKNVSVPDFGAINLDIRLEADGLQSVGINADLEGGIKASIMFDNFSIGKKPEFDGYNGISDYIDAQVGDESNYTYSVKELVYSLLEGVSLDVDAKLSLAAGNYNIMDIVSLFGIENTDGVATPWTVSKDSTVDATLSARLALDPATEKISAVVKIILNKDFALGTDKILPAGELISVYLSEDGTGYIDLSGIELFGVNLPALKANIDLTSVTDKLSESLNTDLVFDVSGLFGTSEEETLSRLNADASSKPLSMNSQVTAEASDIIINSDSLKVNVTLATVSALLNAFGVSIALPDGLEADLSASLDGEGLNVELDASVAASEGYDALGLGLGISVGKGGLMTGVDGMSAEIENTIRTETADLADAQSNVIKALLGTVGKMTIEAEIDVTSDENADLGAFVEQFVKTWLPDTDIRLNVSGGKVKLSVALNSERGEYSVVLSEGDGNELIGARATGDTIVVTVVDFGSFLLRDTGIVATIEKAVNDAIAGIENADLNTLFSNLLNPKDDPSQPEGGEGTEEPSQPGGGEGSGTAIDIVSLLGGISVDDAVINIDITREMIAGILSTFGIEVDFVSAGGAIDIFGGKAQISAVIGDNALELGIGLSIGRTDDETTDYAYARAMLAAYGDEGFVPTGENDAENLRAYLVAGLKAYGEYRSYMDSWSLSALSTEYTRYVQSDSVLVFTSRDDLRQYVMGILEGVSLEAEVTLDFTPGEYNILELVSKFTDIEKLGLPADSKLIVSFGEPSVDLSIRFNSAIRNTDSGVEGVMGLEIITEKDLSFGTTLGGGDAVTVIPAGEALLAVYIYDDSLYINVTALEVLGLSLPVFKAENFDLPEFLYNQIDSMLKGIFAEDTSEGDGTARELALAGGDGGTIALTIARNRLQLSATVSAIGALLSNFLTGDSAATVSDILAGLGDMEVAVNLDRDDTSGNGVYKLSLSAQGSVMNTADGQPSDLSLAISSSTADMKIGDETLYDTYGAYVGGIIDGYDTTYSDILRGIADNLFKGSMLIDVDVDFNEGKYYLNGLINNILSALTDKEGIEVPISVQTGDFTKQLQLALQWNLNPDTKQLKLMFEVRNGADVLIGAYMYDGELVVDLTGVGLISLKVTNVAVIQQLTETLTSAIDSLQGLDLNELLGGLFGDSSATTMSGRESGTAAGEGSDDQTQSGDNAWIAQLLGVVMLENTNIKLALSTQLLEDIIFALAGAEIDLSSDLFDLSANLGILSGKVSFDATLFGEKENALIGMSIDAALSNDTIVSNEYIQAIFLHDHYELDATDTSTIIKDVLDNIADVEFGLDLSVSFKKGTYNVAELLADFGVKELAGTQLAWTFTEDTDIALTLKVSLKTYADDNAGGKNGMASIELVAKNDFNLGASNFLKAGSVVLGLYAYEDVLYIDASGIKLLGITFPVFRSEFDLLGAVVEKLKALGNSSEEESVPVAVVTSETGETTVMTPVSDENGEISVGITEDEIAVTATLGAIVAVLADFGVDLGIDLSAFDLSAAIRIKDGLSVEVGGVLLPTTDGTENPFEMKLSVPSDALKFGIDVNELESYLRSKADAYKDYNDDLIETLKQTLGNNSIKANLTVDAEASQVDLNSLISGLLKTLGVDLTIPLEISFDELYYDLEILFNWNMETRQLMLEVNMNNTANQKTIMGIYGNWESLYIALGGVGLVDLQVKGSPLVPALFNKLDEVLAGIDPIVLSDILSQLFYGKDIAEEAANIPVNDGEASADAGADELATGRSDIIKYLLSAIKITDGEVVADITSDIMSQILRAVGFDIDFVLEAGVSVDLAGELIEGYINLGSDAKIGLTLGFNGKAENFIPSDTSKFIVLDTTEEEVDGGKVVKEFLDGYDFTFALDLKTNTVGTVVDSGEADNQYTRVEIKKLEGAQVLSNNGSTAGGPGKKGILVSVYDISEAEYYTHGSGTKTAILYMYLDYENATATLYLGQGYFKIVALGGLVTLDLVGNNILKSANLNLDILGMLAPTVENLIKQVNDAANNLGQEETPSVPEETPSQGEGETTTETEPTGFAKVIADLDIEALLRPGIKVSLLSTGVGNINVQFDAYELNKLIDGIMGCVFGANTQIDLTSLSLGDGMSFSKNYLAYMWWDRIAMSNIASSAASGGTPYSVWDSIIKQLDPLITDLLKNTSYGNYVGMVNLEGTSQVFHKTVKRLLPLAVWNEAEVNVNFIEGTLVNISFRGVDTGEEIKKYKLDENGQWQQTNELLQHKVASLYKMANSSWDSQSGGYAYTYNYGTITGISGTSASYDSMNYGGGGIMYRSGYRYNADNGQYQTNNYQFHNEIQIYNMSSSVGDPSYTLNGTEGVVDWGNLSANMTFNPYMYSSSNGYQAAVDEYWTRYFSNYGTAVYQKATAVKRGTIALTYNGNAFTKDILKTIMNTAGTHTITATATFSDGTTASTHLTLKVKDVKAGGQDSVRTVDTVNLHVYESLPDYFTVTTYSGEKVRYYTDGSTVRLTGDYKATSPSGGTKTAYLTFANGSSYPVTINYYDSTIKDQTIDLSWYDLDFTGADTEAGKDAVVQALLERFNLYYADGTFIPEVLSDGAVWDTSALYELVTRNKGDLSAAEVKVTVTFNKRISSDGVTLEDVENALVQKVTLTLKMADKRKLSVVYTGATEGNYLTVDPYKYYLYKVTGDESYNPIPSTVTATYVDGTKETISVITEFGDDTDWSYMMNSTVKATLKIDPAAYEGKGYFDENMQISINISRNVIAAVYFDEAKTQNYIVRGQSYKTATVVFTNGLELVMPVAVVENGNTADVYIGFDVEMYNEYGKIAAFSEINGTLLQAFTVEIR